MDQSLTSEKLNFLHSLLDKELEGLKESSLSNSGMKIGNMQDNQLKSHQSQSNNRLGGVSMQTQEKVIKSQSTNFHLNNSNNSSQRDPLPLTPLESSLNISRQNHQRSNSQTPIKDELNILYKQYNSNQVMPNNEVRNKQGQPVYFDINQQQQQQLQQQHHSERDSQPQPRHQSNQPQDVAKNIRMSHDLQELQNKIMNLEKKIISINNPQQEDKENSYLFQDSGYEEKNNHSKDLIEHSFSKTRMPTYDPHEASMEDDYARKDKHERHSKNNMFDTFNTFHDNTQGGSHESMMNTRKTVRYHNTQENQYPQGGSQEEMSDDYYQTQMNSKKMNKQQPHTDQEAFPHRAEEDEKDEDTPMKRKYKKKPKSKVSPHKYNTSRFNTETSENGGQSGGNKSNSLKRGHSSSASTIKNTSIVNTSGLSGKREVSKNRANKFQLEKKIQEAESVLNNSKNSIKRSLSRNNSLNRNNSVKNISNTTTPVHQYSTNSASKRNSSNSVNKTQKSIDQVIANHNEVQVLNKKIMQLKKSSEQDRQLIIKERIRNNELNEEVEKLNRKMKKMANQIEKSNALDDDYKKLMQSFEKSEYIRQQQKQLITNLKNELDFFKQNSANTSVHQQPSQEQGGNERKRQKSKQKTTN